MSGLDCTTVCETVMREDPGMPGRMELSGKLFMQGDDDAQDRELLCWLGCALVAR